MCAPTTIRGTERYKFYKKPIKPFVQQYPPGVMLAPPTAIVQEHTQAERQMREIHGTSEIYSVGCQTVYRDSEVQTDPYTPDYYIKPQQYPPGVMLAPPTAIVQEHTQAERQ